MGQEPNIRLGVEQLPRPAASPAAPSGWVPRRPGEIGSPADVPWGGAFGTPGPDIGFAYRVVRGRDLPGPERIRGDVEAAVVAVMAARASAIGRAPTAGDVDAALRLLEESGTDIEQLAGIAHDRTRLGALVAAIPTEQLIS